MPHWFCLGTRVGAGVAAPTHWNETGWRQREEGTGWEVRMPIWEKKQKMFFAFTCLPPPFFFLFETTIDLGSGIGDSYLYPRGNQAGQTILVMGWKMEVIVPLVPVPTLAYYMGFLCRQYRDGRAGLLGFSRQPLFSRIPTWTSFWAIGSAWVQISTSNSEPGCIPKYRPVVFVHANR